MAGFLMSNPNAMPGVGTEIVAAIRELLMREANDRDFFPVGSSIDGSNSADPDNPTGRTDVIRDGMPMGKITATNKYAPSIIGQVATAYNGSTTLTLMSTAEVAEIVRRIGATGTFKLTGPASAAGTVRTLTVAYSATGSGSGQNEVQTVAWSSAPTAGTFKLSFTRYDGVVVTTAAIAYGATCSTTVAAAINAVLGTSAVSCTASGSTTADNGFYVTFSGTNYTKVAQPALTVDQTGITAWTSTSAAATVTRTTPGIPAATALTVTAKNVNCVQTVSFPIASTGGSVVIEFTKANGQRMAAAAASWSGTDTTYLAAIQSALDTATGVSNGIVASAIAQTDTDYGFVLTFSGTGYAALPQDLVKITTLPTSSTSYSVAMTTTGVNGAFVAGSLVQPTDGSETIITLLKTGSKTGVSVYNALLQRIDVQFPQMLINGIVRTSYILGYAGNDASTKAYIKAALRAAGGVWLFDDDFLGVAV